MAGIDNPRTDTHEENTILPVLGVELGHGGIQPGLANRVQGGHSDLVLVNDVRVRMAAGYGYHFLGSALEEERNEQVEEMDVGDDVGLEIFQHVVFEFLRCLASVCTCM